MKKLRLFLIFLIFNQLYLSAQLVPAGWDTVLVANFESGHVFEPGDLDPSEPTGFDQDWVNFSESGHAQFCLDSVETEGWYPLYDFTDPNNLSENVAFTSCSYTTNEPPSKCSKPTRNWLILPPIQIHGGLAAIHWKSASYYGPYWLDGYKLMVSTTGNFPADFTETLFSAAEMIDVKPGKNFGSLVPNDYQFSAGYVQANTYSDPKYYLFGQDPLGYDNLLGQFEPHSADLSKFEGKKIYLAFLHDSHCDAHLQIDDIVVVDNGSVGFADLPNLGRWQLSPNPARDFIDLKIELKNPIAARLLLRDFSGKLLKTFELGEIFAGDFRRRLDLTGLPTGIFVASLETAAGSFSQKIMMD